MYSIQPKEQFSIFLLQGTTFLTNVFILQGVTEQTVRVDVTTSLQMFVLVNILMVVVALLEYLLVLFMVSRPKSSYKIPVLLLGAHFIRESRSPHTHKLDLMFRFAAPLVYFVFCSAYFCHYLL